MKKAFLFPGQGSQFVGMGRDLYDNFNSAKLVYEEVDDAIGENLTKLIFDGPIEELSLTANTQPALMTVSMSIIKILKNDFGIVIEDNIDFVAGHSLGEYSAYTAIDSLSISQSAKLLKIRGNAMQNSSNSGSMLALIGVAIEEVRSIIDDLGDEYICDIANDNCPGQIVLSGDDKAIDNIMSITKNKGYKSIRLQVSAAFHSKLMNNAKIKMKETFGNIEILSPKIPLIANIYAAPIEYNDIKNSLIEQVTNMVRWRESIDYLIKKDVTSFFEIGAGKILSNINKRISKDISSSSVESIKDIEHLANILS